MAVLEFMMLNNDWNIDKKFQPSILNSCREMKVTDLLLDVRKYPVNYRVATHLKKLQCQ